MPNGKPKPQEAPQPKRQQIDPNIILQAIASLLGKGDSIPSSVREAMYFREGLPSEAADVRLEPTYDPYTLGGYITKDDKIELFPGMPMEESARLTGIPYPDVLLNTLAHELGHRFDPNLIRGRRERLLGPKGPPSIAGLSEETYARLFAMALLGTEPQDTIQYSDQRGFFWDTPNVEGLFATEQSWQDMQHVIKESHRRRARRMAIMEKLFTKRQYDPR